MDYAGAVLEVVVRSWVPPRRLGVREGRTRDSPVAAWELGCCAT